MEPIASESIEKNIMVSLLKTIIILLALVSFIYAARLAVLGDLESYIIMRDYHMAQSYITTVLQPLFGVLDEFVNSVHSKIRS